MSQRILVTGGGGFLGGYIVRALLEREDTVVGSMTRSAQPELEALGVQTHKGDISNRDDVQRVLKDYDAIIHTAAMVNPWGDKDAFYRANVTGTEILLEEAKKAGITRFVFTSSPSVVFDGTPLVNAMPDTPYPDRFPSPYGETKALSEKLVKEAHDADGLRTVSLRPQLMWGPGDPHLLPLIIKRARAGKLRQIGDAKTLIDATFVSNAAQAHLDALDALDKKPDDPTNPGGKIYFISNDEPVHIWDFIPQMLAMANEPALKPGSIPKPVAALIGRAFDTLWSMLGLASEPPVSEFVVLKMCTDQWYSMEPAKRDLGYTPAVSIKNGQKLWADWYNSQP